jgi:polysaccharide deacetylase family protein (PEP-CTERM system associated)
MSAVTARDERPLNGISVDVEDWLQSTIDPTLPLSERFHPNTQKVLDAFARRNVRGTFFVLGLAAEKAPGLVREIQAAGHEIQSHGYGHEIVYSITRERFKADVERSKKMLEDMTGRRICGYRAPAFSITLANLWALDVLVELGFEYDSSVFPIELQRYGIGGAPWYPHRLRAPGGGVLTEVPVATYRWAGRRMPLGGGGYFRLFPYFLIRNCVQQLNSAGQSATIYMHPYEYNPDELKEIVEFPISWKTRLHQGLGRRGFPRKVDRLMSEFRFGCMRDLIAEAGELPIFEHRRSVAA